MSRIAHYFSTRFKELIAEAGVVVWYDPGKIYETILPEMVLDGYPVFRYEGSFFALRHAIEPLLAAAEKSGALIYVPLSRPATHHALIEAECAGCYLEPDHPQHSLNTRLEQIAAVLLEPVLPGQIDSIVQKIQEGSLDLADIDRLAEAGYSSPAATLNLIYDKSDPLEIFYEFLVRPELDDKVVEKNACREVFQLATQHLGYDGEEQQEIGQMRQKLLRWLLLHDFLSAFPKDEIPANLSHLYAPRQEQACKNTAAVTNILRQRHLAQNCYQEAARNLEKSLPLHDMTIREEILLKAQTLPALERMLLIQLASHLLENRNGEADLLLQTGRERYWAQWPPWNLHWHWLATVHSLFTSAAAIQVEMDHSALSAPELVSAYCRAEQPWYLFDRLYQEMEIRFHAIESDPSGPPDLYERLLVRARQRYAAIVRAQANNFQTALQECAFQASPLLRQRDIYDERVAPILPQSKLAYIQVDALRYDLAAQVAQMLPQNIQVQLEPALGQLPGITAIGMAAALPGASRHTALAHSGRNAVGLRVQNQALFSREERKKFLEQHTGSPGFCAVELEALHKPRKAIREAIFSSRFVWVACQEIDAIAENLNPILARGFIEKLLHDLRRGILHLFELGIEKIILVADHGFLFGDEATPGERIDAPGGQTALLHRRVWIGRGGASHPAYMRISEKEIGLDGDMELIFPSGASIFKSPGGNLCFFHGGISLQEMVIPVMTLAMTPAVQSTMSLFNITMTLEKQTITNRVFLVRIKYQSSDLFAPERVTLRLVLQSNNKPAARVLLATPQPENKGQEIIIGRGQEVTITCALDEGTAPATLDLLLYDFNTEVLVTDVKNTKIDLLD